MQRVRVSHRVELAPINEGGVLQLAEEEQFVVVSVVKLVLRGDIDLLEVPDLAAAVGTARHKVFVVEAPVNVMNQIVVALQNNLQLIHFILDVEYLHN